MSVKPFKNPACGHTEFDETCGDCQNMWDEHRGPMTESDKTFLETLEQVLDLADDDQIKLDSFEYYYGKTYRLLKRKKDIEDMN